MSNQGQNGTRGLRKNPKHAAKLPLQPGARPSVDRDQVSQLVVRVEPETPVAQGSAVVLEAGQAMKFTAKDAAGAPVEVRWALVHPRKWGAEVVGSLNAATGSSVTYTAPQEIRDQRSITILAQGAGASDKMSILLVPGKVTIIPGEVVLRAGQKQQFKAQVSDEPNGAVDWEKPAPTLGVFDTNGLYIAPTLFPEGQTVIITATSRTSGRQGSARITLLGEPPWWLGLFLIFLFAVVIIVYMFWPPPLDRTKLNAAQAADLAAQQVLKERQAELNEANATATRLAGQLEAAESAAPDASAPALAALQAEKQKADENVRVSSEATLLAQQDADEKKVTATNEQAAIDQAYQDERSLFFLVMVAGALGSFVHTTRSFADFAGNQTLRQSWTWWYILHPFTGSALAVVVYLVLRGGFFGSVSAGEGLNPFGFVAVAALVGLFSKQATRKLDDVFTTIFSSNKEKELKDKLDESRPDEQRTTTTTHSV